MNRFSVRRPALRITLSLLLGLLFLASLGIAFEAWRMLPTREGAITAPGLLATVTVGRDDADVTHIQAESDRDAWFALGYVHAQERSWQLEFNRRLMHGRLSEVLGPATLELDKLMRTLGIVRAAHAQLQTMPPDVLAALQAYSDGVASFRTHGRQAYAPEFRLLRVQPGGWDPVDTVGWTLMMALDLGGNWGTEFARLSAAQVLDNERLWQLFPPYEGEAPASTVDLPALYHELGVYRDTDEPLNPPHQAQSSETALRNWVTAQIDALGTPSDRGSNNWAVTGDYSRSGLPLLANDPHLDLSAPAIWYMVNLQAPNLQVAGATMPGLPFVVLGRTREAAWTFTNTGPDVQDLYLEALDPEDPNRYRTPDGWAEFTRRHEVIAVKGQDDVRLTVRESRHGPILSDVQRSHHEVLDLERYVLALRWSALDPDNHTVVAGIRMNQANSVDEMLAAGRYHHSPMQSMIMADTDGAVAFKAVGRVPLRHPDNDIRGVAPAPGWDPRYDWTGWLPYDDTPEELAPSRWIATANQRVQNPDYPYFIGQEWHPPYRHQRILELLEHEPQHDLASFRRIQADVLSPAAVRLLPFLQAAAAESRDRSAQRIVTEFTGEMAADEPAPLIFVAWADELTQRLLAPKVGATRFDRWYGARHFRRSLEMILEEDLQWWCAPDSCADQSRQAYEAALQRLRNRYGPDPDAWRWGQAHPALSLHRPLGEVSWLSAMLNVQVPSGGDHFTINVGQYRATGDQPYANRQAASLRLLFDLSNLDNSRFIYQTGQSGIPFARRYRDMRDEWAAVEDRPLRMSPAEFQHLLYLTP